MRMAEPATKARRDGQLDDATIGRYSGLALEVVQRLRQETPHGLRSPSC
jgi:hypothetical protein